MKKIFYIAVVCIGLSLSGCSDFLNSRNLFDQSTETFFRTPEHMMQALGGVYDALTINTPTGLGDEIILANLLADYTFAGGGADDYRAWRVADFTNPGEDAFRPLWIRTYEGVHRANTLIEALYRADLSAFFPTEAEATTFINTIKGEAYFLRGFFMFRAARFWGGMPLINSTGAPRNVPRSSFSETFAQIADDFNTAAGLLPRVNINTIGINDAGRVTVWGAKGYLARTFMFYTGYMTNMMNTPTTELTLPDGTRITRAQIITHLEDVINNSGHELLSDPRNLWPYAFVNQRAGRAILPWAEAEGLEWAGQDGPHSVFGTGNRETMFAVRHAFGEWYPAGLLRRRNAAALHFGLRNQDGIEPYGQGWGWAPVNRIFYSEWNTNDLRRRGSILNLDSTDEGITFNQSANNGFHHTGLVIKKYIGIRHDGQGMFFQMFNPGAAHNDFGLDNAQDYLLLRFADILLMHSELTETATGMNQVRNRAGLSDVPFSLRAVINERKYEFAFEGIRWFDLLRTGDVNNPAYNYFGRPVAVLNNNVEAMHSVTFRAETRGLLPIPESEIRLSDGVYTQNPGW